MQPEFRLLNNDWGTQLNELAQACPIQADFSFWFDRSPDFFAWPCTVFDDFQYLGLFDKEKLVGSVMAGLYNGWYGQYPVRLAYFAEGRIHPHYRGHKLIGKAVYKLGSILKDRFDLAFVLIKKGNFTAKKLAQSFFPAEVEVQTCSGYDAINIFPIRPVRCTAHYEIRPLRSAEHELLRAFLEQEYRGRTLAPQISADTMKAYFDSVGGPQWKNTYCAFKNGEIMGTVTAWDMTALKRIVLIRYSIVGKLLRLAYRTGSLISRNIASLPAVNAPLRILTLTRLAVRDNSPEICRELLARVVNDYQGKGFHLIDVGLTENDPLQAALTSFYHKKFSSEIFIAHWRDKPIPQIELLNTPPAFLDIALI